MCSLFSPRASTPSTSFSSANTPRNTPSPRSASFKSLGARSWPGLSRAPPPLSTGNLCPSTGAGNYFSASPSALSSQPPSPSPFNSGRSNTRRPATQPSSSHSSPSSRSSLPTAFCTNASAQAHGKARPSSSSASSSPNSLAPPPLPKPPNPSSKAASISAPGGNPKKFRRSDASSICSGITPPSSSSPVAGHWPLGHWSPHPLSFPTCP